eukprot:11217055-Lingulodinium_polyedra.AAC.1
MVAYDADGDVGDPEAEVTATFILDLVKASERVQLGVAWRWGMRVGFPPALLAMVLTIFDFARRRSVGGCCADELQTCAAI